jgi:hypothetical protein
MRILLIGIVIWSLSLTARAHDFAVYVRNLHEEGLRRSVSPVALPLPAYPADLVRAGIAGHVSFRFCVNADGSVGELSVLDAPLSEFIEPAMKAVASWKFAVTSDATEKVPAISWMRCTFVFRVNVEPNYFPTFAAGFADTNLGGREVIQLATEQAQKDGIELDQFTRFGSADVFLSDTGHTLMWGVTWRRAGVPGGYYRVWINDTTRSVKVERSESAEPGATDNPGDAQ